jgi:hypothetical protein
LKERQTNRCCRNLRANSHIRRKNR